MNKDEEILKLKQALVNCAAEIGVKLSNDCSVEFLCEVPKELGLYMKKVHAKSSKHHHECLIEAREMVEYCKNKILEFPIDVKNQ